MLSPDTIRAIDLLASELKNRFEPPEFIPGCEVKDIDDKDQYSTNNGWIEAIVSKHNRQRCRWKGQVANIATGCFVDVLYYPSYKVYTVAGQSGSGVVGAPLNDSVLEAKGDLIVASAANVPANLSVGADTHILIADSACPLGVKWGLNTGASGINFEGKYTAKGDLTVGVAASSASALNVGTNEHVLTADSACDLGVKWAAQSAADAISHSFLGYNSIGGSMLDMVNRRTYLHKITPAASGIILSVDAHIENAVGQVGGLVAAVMDHNSGSADKIIGAGPFYTDNQIFLSASKRWVSFPINSHVSAGSYYLAIMNVDGTGDTKLYYDGATGSDSYFAVTGDWLEDGNLRTQVDVTDAYSIRASFLS